VEELPLSLLFPIKPFSVDLAVAIPAVIRPASIAPLAIPQKPLEPISLAVAFAASAVPIIPRFTSSALMI
jgi:hypothetical protein